MTLLFSTPVVYDGDDARFLRRDGARFLPALAAHGDRGIKVVLAKSDAAPRPASPDLRAATFREWCDPDFWKTFRADGALCYFGFSDRRFLPVVRAMRAAGLRLALKADSSFGLHRFPRHAAVWFRKCYWVARQRHSPAAAFGKAMLDMAKWIRGFDAGTMIPYLESFDALTVESPLAAENTRDWLLRHERPDLADRVAFLPHPVPDDFVFDPTRDTKENLVLAVAQDWRNPRKGGAILGGALDRFLANHPDWRATIVGSNADRVAARAPRTRSRIDLRPPQESVDLLPLYRSAKIFLTASGSEAAPNVVFESLACGCSVVFPPELLQLSWIRDAGLGAMSGRRSPSALATSLDSEAAAWKLSSCRTPSRILPLLRASDILPRLFSDAPTA